MLLTNTMIEKNTPAFYAASFALCLAAVFVFANLHMLQPLLPLLSREFQLTPLQTSWSYAIGTLALDDGSSEYWLGLPNFYAVMTYNPRIFYAMAVTQLAMRIETAQTAATGSTP